VRVPPGGRINILNLKNFTSALTNVKLLRETKVNSMKDAAF
jgi:hypothetical protein